jgi:1-deoxy-D-xylulose-5-phosphate synthase
VGGDGAVHHGFCDIALLATLPNACLMAAMDEPSLKAAVDFMAGFDAGLSAVRYPRDSVSAVHAGEACPPFVLGKARPLVTHPDAQVALIAYGTCVIDATDAARELKLDGIKADVYDARFAKPVDIELIAGLVARGIPIVTIEDHSIRGGFGSCVLEACNERRIETRGVTRMAMPDRWIYQGERKEQLEEAGLDPLSIANTARKVAMQASRAAMRI